MNEFATLWASALWTATWQGCLLIPLVWAITRLFRNLPAVVVVWLWRLSILKVLAALVFPIPIYVAAANESVSSQDSVSLAAMWVLGFSALALLAFTVELVLQWRAVRRLLFGAMLYTGALRSPGARLLVSDAADRPMLLAHRGRHSIILPSSLLEEPRNVQEMVVAHELAHLRFGDLKWNWLMFAPQTLLFFHPLVRLAAHELRQAQETACDQAARASTGASVRQYGEMLLKLAVKSRTMPLQLGAASIASDHRSLRVRLQRLSAGRKPSRLLSALLIVLCLVTLPAWKLVEQESDPAVFSPVRMSVGRGIAVAQPVVPPARVASIIESGHRR